MNDSSCKYQSFYLTLLANVAFRPVRKLGWIMWCNVSSSNRHSSSSSCPQRLWYAISSSQQVAPASNVPEIFRTRTLMVNVCFTCRKYSSSADCMTLLAPWLGFDRLAARTTLPTQTTGTDEIDTLDLDFHCSLPCIRCVCPGRTRYVSYDRWLGLLLFIFIICPDIDTVCLGI